MSEHASKVVRIARSWIGTPYLHQASLKGAGTDCLGLIRGIWRELHTSEPAQIPAYTEDWSEPQGDEQLWNAALEHLVPVDEQGLKVGNILLFRMKAGAVASTLVLLEILDPPKVLFTPIQDMVSWKANLRRLAASRRGTISNS